MSDFRPLSERELLQLSPEELIAHHHEARRVGQQDAARAALAILVWGFEDRVRFWVARKVPKADVQDVVGDVIESAIKSSFDGVKVAQFGAWLRQITSRRVADYFGARERRPEEKPLAEEHEGEEDIWGAQAYARDQTEDVVERSVVEQALTEQSDVHSRVVELGGPKLLGFDQAPAKEVAQVINDQFSGPVGDAMTDVNVHQILSRFRRRVGELLDLDNPGEGDG
jgi:DNA-directed RNA polymerase specialized sigma24 family protein